MEQLRIFLLGSSLMTSSIAAILDADNHVELVGSAVTVDDALAAMAGRVIDAIIVMGTDNQTTVSYWPVFAEHPNVPIIRADISQNSVQVITSQSIEAKGSVLLAALAELPRRSSSGSASHPKEVKK